MVKYDGKWTITEYFYAVVTQALREDRAPVVSSTAALECLACPLEPDFINIINTITGQLRYDHVAVKLRQGLMYGMVKGEVDLEHDVVALRQQLKLFKQFRARERVITEQFGGTFLEDVIAAYHGRLRSCTVVGDCLILDGDESSKPRVEMFPNHKWALEVLEEYEKEEKKSGKAPTSRKLY